MDPISPAQLDCVLQSGQLHDSGSGKTFVPSGFQALRVSVTDCASTGPNICHGSAEKHSQKTSASVCMSYRLEQPHGGSVATLAGLQAKAIHLKSPQEPLRSSSMATPTDLHSLALEWLVQAADARHPSGAATAAAGEVYRSGIAIPGSNKSFPTSVMAALQGVVASALPGLSGRVQGCTRASAPCGRGQASAAAASATMWGVLHTLAVEIPSMSFRATEISPVSAGVKKVDASVTMNLEAGPGLPGAGHPMTSRSASCSSVPMLRPRPGVPALANGPYGLLPKSRGSLSAGLTRCSLADEPTWSNVPKGKCWVDVRAVGINFRDVLNVLGMYPGDPGPPGKLSYHSQQLWQTRSAIASADGTPAHSTASAVRLRHFSVNLFAFQVGTLRASWSVKGRDLPGLAAIRCLG